MGIDDFLIPILSGYLLLARWTRSSYQTERRSGYHLFFYSLASGILLWLMAACVTRLWGWAHEVSFLLAKDILPEFVTIEQGLCLLTGFLFPFIGNRFVNAEKQSRKVIEQYGNDTEKLIDEAVRSVQLVEVTTKNRKVYVGIPVESNLLSRKDSGIAMVPLASGYRKESTMELVFTTWYADVIDQAMAKNEVADILQMRIVLPFQQLASVRKFIPETYDRFAKEANNV